MIGNRQKTRRRAFSFVETAFSVLLVGGVVVAALNSVGAATTGRQFADGRARGQLLAESLMTEILAQAYQDENNLGTLGLESGETGANRTKFDDVDDYRNYTDSPPSLHNGDPIEGFSNWSRSVVVLRADPQSLNAIATAETGLKRIKITVECSGVPVASLVGFKTQTDPPAGKSKEILVKELEIVLEPVELLLGGLD